MPVEAACPSCEGKFRLPDAAAGKKIRCPKCKGPLEVPPLTPEAPVSTAPPLAVSPAIPPTPPSPAPVVPTPSEGLKSTWRSAPQDPAPVTVTPRVEKQRVEAPKTQTVVAPQPTKSAITKQVTPLKPAAPVEPAKKPAAPAPTISPPAPAPNPAPLAKPKPPEIKPQTLAPTPPVEQWFLKGEDGETFGPVDRPTLDGWHKEGRMTADSQLLKHGTEQWQWASDLYPDLEEPEPEPEPPALVSKAAAESSIHPAAANVGSTVFSTKSISKQTTLAAEDEEELLSPHSKPVAFLLALTLGMFGIHRFYLGYVGIGLAMFFTCGGLFVWSITDALRILFGHVTDSEGLKLRD